MMYKIEPTKAFEKALRRLAAPEQKAVATKLRLLVQNPYHPSLRTKKVHGIKDLFESSVNMDIRFLWKYKDQSILLLLDIGHHYLVDHL